MLDNLGSLESDFSAIHHIQMDIDVDDFGGLSAAKFFRMCDRLPAYEGVMHVLVLEQDRKRKARAGGAEKIIDLTPEMAAGNGQATGLDGLIEWGHG